MEVRPYPGVIDNRHPSHWEHMSQVPQDLPTTASDVDKVHFLTGLQELDAPSSDCVVALVHLPGHHPIEGIGGPAALVAILPSTL